MFNKKFLQEFDLISNKQIIYLYFIMSTTLLKIINKIRENSNLDMSHIEDHFTELKKDNILYEKINELINKNDRDLDCSYRDLYLLYKSITKYL